VAKHPTIKTCVRGIIITLLEQKIIFTRMNVSTSQMWTDQSLVVTWGKLALRSTQSLPFELRLLRQCFLLGFFLTPVIAAGQAPDFAEMLGLASQGNVQAQYNLGLMYSAGMGVPVNNAEAVKWYHLAADQGNAIAQFNLGVMYANGEGVPSNSVIAYAWLNIAAASGDKNTIHNRSIVEAKMTSSQITAAQQLSTEIFERIKGSK
jgi:TPR repeat protein